MRSSFRIVDVRQRWTAKAGRAYAVLVMTNSESRRTAEAPHTHPPTDAVSCCDAPVNSIRRSADSPMSHVVLAIKSSFGPDRDTRMSGSTLL